MITVREAIELLQKEDPDRVLICSSDSEGNSYSPLSGFSTGAYLPETTWSGSIGLEELTPELEAAGYAEEDVCEGGVKALFLDPVS